MSGVLKMTAVGKQNDDEKNLVKGKETRNCVFLAVAFFAAFTAYQAMQNLQSSLNEDKGLGIISLSVLYGCIILSGILAPTVIRSLSVKGCIILAWVIHLIYIASNFYPSFYTLIPSSILLGSISGFLWTSQSTYIATCAYSFVETSTQSEFTILSRLNGLFFTIFEMTQIPGNLLSSLILQRGTDTNATTVAICGADYCPGTGNGSALAKPDSSVVYTLLGVFLAFDVIALLVTIFLLSPVPKSHWIKNIELKGALSSFFKTCFTTKLLFLLPFIMYQALEQAILWSDYTRSFISCPLGIQMVGYVMAIYGATTATSAFCFSKLAKWLPRYILFSVTSILQGGVFVALYLWTPTKENEVFIFLLVIPWGLGEGIWQTQGNALIAMLFPDKKEPAFANFHTWKAVSFTITFAVSNFMCLETKLLYVIGLLLVGMVLYAGVEIYTKITEKKTRSAAGMPEMK